MGRSLTLVTAPDSEPIEIDRARLHLRVDHQDDDTLILALVKAAREWAETFTRRALITQTWRLSMAEWPKGDTIRVPLPPLQSVASITYKDQDGDESTFSSSSYIVDTDKTPGEIVLAHGESWPSGSLYPTSPISVTFAAGYGATASTVPASIRQAMLLLIGHLYENREDTVATGNIQYVPMGARSLLWPYRVLEF